ncbi:MAG: FAD-dependent thymidylate synthase [Euryarchaeota archaeon]|nr:FAD-dependent thymidylate synthase [Euryarchaeota archaeon]
MAVSLDSPGVLTAPPRVALIAFTERPYDLAIASARTCYSPGLRFTEEVTEGQRERIGESIYEAGHHTPFQHPTFVFGLENVSRQFVWSFLHSHPFYNSEQSSQRYNLLKEARVYVPPLSGENARIYEEAVSSAWTAYNRINELLQDDNYRLMAALGKRKGQDEKAIRRDASKKAMEMGRYVLPVAAFTSMYHTISGIELKRYARMANTGDCPTESAHVVSMMLAEVRKIDPDFIDRVGEGPIPFEQLPETQAVGAASGFAARFDASLDGLCSRLVAHTPGGEELVAEAAREVIGAGPSTLSDEEMLDTLVNPARNAYMLDTLNVWTHSPFLRALNHVQLTYRKRISHAADSQDQRHRTVPASRPLLTRTHTRAPDYITPGVIADNPRALSVYRETMDALWTAKNTLIENGAPAEAACYLLPNATPIRFTESGSLLNLMHKWRMRTCFLAQEEIYQASMEELAQARRVYPRVTKHIGPPCFFRDGLVEDKELEGPCPEGDRWCGVDVWKNFPNVKRPF